MQELLKLGSFAASAIENDTVSFIAVDNDGIVLTCNRAFCELTGYSKEEVGSMKWPDNFTPSGQRAYVASLLSKIRCEMTSNGHTPHRFEKMSLRKDGSTIPVEVFLHAFCQNRDTPRCYYSVIADISEQKRVEDSLRKARNELESEVKARTDELKRANEALKQEIIERKKAGEDLNNAVAQADLYLDLMSHDISNMNHAAMGYLELALDSINEVENKELLARPLDIIKNTSRLIDNVKKLRQIQDKGIRPVTIDLGKVLSDVKSEYEIVPERDITINYSPVNCHLVQSCELLKDVFRNLVENAIKHSTGPLTINMGVTRAFMNGKEYCRVFVEDDGPGIPDNIKVKLFGPKSSERDKSSRIGLGLYLVKSIVETYGGSAWAEDRDPCDYTKGCRFVVMLPVIEK